MATISCTIFIADAHLGRLARYLRLLGFNTLYSNAYTAAEIRAIAREEDRVVLSKSAAFHKVPDLSFLQIGSSDPAFQLEQVVRHFYLQEMVRPFTRCLVCNGELSKVTKESVVHALLPETRRFFQEFWQCMHCNRVYWKGAHYERMQALLERVSDWR